MSDILLVSVVIAQRVFNPLYIYLDIVFLVGLCALLAEIGRASCRERV